MAGGRQRRRWGIAAALVVAVSAASAVGVGDGAGAPASTMWTAQAHPEPQVPRPAEFDGVNCVTTSNCTAVGYLDTATGPHAGDRALERSSFAAIASPGGPQSELHAVTCWTRRAALLSVMTAASR